MRILSVLVIFQGVGIFIQSILGLYRGTITQITKLGPYSINYNIVGVVIGILLIITGIGIWYRKKYAYNSTIILYSLFIINGIFSVGFSLMIQTMEPGSIVLITLAFIYCFMLIRYVQKYKSEFK